MNLDQTVADLTALPVRDRLHVIESLWNSIDDDTSIEMTETQKEELARRLEEHERNPDDVLTMEQVHAELRARR